MLLTVLIPVFGVSALAAPASQFHPRAAAPTVTINNGTVVGSTSGNVDSFLGIPFAQPPVGPLRLKPPQSINATFGTFVATSTPSSCPQLTTSVDTENLPGDVIALVEDSPATQDAEGDSEDCLTITVQRPSTADSTSKLPVLMWIFGGGFEFGGISSYDGSGIIQKSIDLGQDVLYVEANYRVGGFGFLAGKELQADGSTNIGLRDQRLAMQWVAENIEAFGGDPDKVTIWGESAGSISVFDQTIINGGDNTYNGAALFRGAIMDSGSVVPALDVASEPAQNIYDSVVESAGCADSDDTLACLRSLDYSRYLEAANSVPSIESYRSLDLSYLPRPDPTDNFFPTSAEVALDEGFAKVPIIIGDQEDEGTLFALEQTNITTTQELVDYLFSYFPNATEADIAELVDLYPDKASAGSPFRTGDLYNIYPQFKRLAAILGDLTFTLTRRSYLNTVAAEVSAWSYLSSYYHATPVLGTFHETDLFVIYDDTMATLQSQILTYYISFVNSLDPNSIAQNITWPAWTNASAELLQFQTGGANNLLADDFRSPAYDFLVSHESELRV
ncbi:putative extracellular lipase [Saccharata proteae CBS 121410]|uniref:Carboxylic ester hydrolase n=1 Tax=Saccharata proteae CBS 121410 TaxID=1314787 RepID=A0A9P4HPI1_9PEZI|nr:putative extracellular lipase [Saccharata proteae CBS 121410]